MPDDKGPSTCVDECLANWPAVEAPVEAGEGVDEALLGTAERPDDGSDQATYNDWPLYYFASDAEPGDINGQGNNDVWFVIGADGRAIPATG
jgi:predicted lipoprotein with Yx(FWY)xxD motif